MAVRSDIVNSNNNKQSMIVNSLIEFVFQQRTKWTMTVQAHVQVSALDYQSRFIAPVCFVFFLLSAPTPSLSTSAEGR